MDPILNGLTSVPALLVVEQAFSFAKDFAQTRLLQMGEEIAKGHPVTKGNASKSPARVRTKSLFFDFSIERFLPP